MSASKCCVEPDGMKRCCTWGQVRGEVRVAVWSPLGCSAQSHHCERRQWLHPQLWREHLCTAHAKTYGTCTIHMRKRYQTPTDTYRKKHACLPQTQTHTHTHTQGQQVWCGRINNGSSLFVSNQPSSAPPLRKMCFSIFGCHGEEMTEESVL